MFCKPGIGMGSFGSLGILGMGGAATTCSAALLPWICVVAPDTQHAPPGAAAFWINHQVLLLLRPTAGADWLASRAPKTGYWTLGPMRQFVLSEAVTTATLG